MELSISDYTLAHSDGIKTIYHEIFDVADENDVDKIMPILKTYMKANGN